MRRFAVGFCFIPVAVWAQPIPMTSEDVAPVLPGGEVVGAGVETGLDVTPTVVVNPAAPPVGTDHIDQVLATVSATISATTALVTSASLVTSPTGLDANPAANPADGMTSTTVQTSPTTMIQPPHADMASKAVVRVTGNAGAQDRVLQALRTMGLAATYTRLTVDGAEMAVPNANADTLAAQLHAKGLTAEMGADGAVEVRF
jgi:hypothetical protein